MAASRWTARRRRLFLAALAETGNVAAAARAAKVSRSHAYALRTADAAFGADWDQALETAVDALEAEARHRALHGVETPHFHQGKVTGTVRKYSDALLMFLLRAHRPGTYRDRADRGATTDDDDLDRELSGARDALAARLARLDQADEPDPPGGPVGEPE